MRPRLIDTHAHVQFQAFAGETDDVLRRTVAAGTWVNLVGTQSTTSANAVDTAERLGEGVFATIGLHPNHLAQMHFDEDEMDVRTRDERFDADHYASLAAHPKTVAVGECGLDYYHLPESIPFPELRELQRQQFGLQLDFAHDYDLPVVVHCRDPRDAALPSAHGDVLALLEERFAAGKNPRRGVIHCYTADEETARRYVALGMYVSFAGVITFPPKKSAPEAQERLLAVARDVPDDRILVETDAPYLAPVPHRGERNEPLYVEHAARFLASLRGVRFEAFCARTTENALALFHKMAQ